MPNPNWYPNKGLSQDLVNRIILDNLYALRDSSKAVVAPATIPATAAASAGSGVSGGGSVSVITEATEDTFFPLQTPLLVNGVSGGNLGSTGNTYVAGRWMMSCADNVGGGGTQGSISLWDIQGVSLSSPPVLVAQLVGATYLYAEGVWMDPTFSYAVAAILGGATPSPAQIANASIKVIALGPTIAAYLAGGAPVAMSVVATLQDSVKLASPENILVIDTPGGYVGYASNVFSTGTNDYTAVDLSSWTAPAVGGTVPHAALAGAVVATYYNGVIYCASRGGESLTQLNIGVPLAPAVKGTPLNLGTQLTGVDIHFYPDLGMAGKTFAFVAGTLNNSLYSIDASDSTAMVIEAKLTSATAYNEPSNVKWRGGICYSTAYGTPSGITLTDVSNPYVPLTLSFTSVTDLGLAGTVLFDHLHIEGSRGYQADTSFTGGVYVLQLGAPSGSGAGAPASIVDTVDVMLAVGSYFKVTETGGATQTLGQEWYGVNFGTQGALAITFGTVYGPIATPTFVTLSFNLPLGSTVSFYTDASYPPTTLISEVSY